MRQSSRMAKPQSSLDEAWARGALAHLPRPRVHRLISVIGFENADLLDIAGPLTTFAAANHIIQSDCPGMPLPYDCEVLGRSAGPVQTSTGVPLVARRGYTCLRDGIDTLIVPGGPRAVMKQVCEDSGLIEAVRRLAPRVARLASVCTGTFVLAKAGLLEGRTAATHWRACQRLADEHPSIDVDRDSIFVKDGHFYSSAGKTAGIDLALAMIEEDLGRDWALAVSRYMVVHLKRPGGQSQFSVPLRAQVDDAVALKGLPLWIAENLHEDLSVPALAARVGMSLRNFIRVFQKEMGATPAKFVEAARIEAARRRLEESRLPLETLAKDLGFGTGERMRRTFQRQVGVNPEFYRERFSGAVSR